MPGPGEQRGRRAYVAQLLMDENASARNARRSGLQLVTARRPRDVRVRLRGFEPPRACAQWLLKPSRMPVSPQPRDVFNLARLRLDADIRVHELDDGAAVDPNAP